MYSPTNAVDTFIYFPRYQTRTFPSINHFLTESSFLDSVVSIMLKNPNFFNTGDKLQEEPEFQILTKEEDTSKPSPSFKPQNNNFYEDVEENGK